jgi:hypothetical protein
MAFFRNQMFNRQPMGFAPRQSRFSGGLGGLFGGMGGFNPYQQQMPMMGGFNPYMGGGFNPYMGGGFNPYMGRGFNPYMGGRFSPMMRGGFEGYDFDSPIGEAPPGVEPTPPPPPPSISDLYGGLDEAQRNAFLEQYGLAPTPPPPAPIERPDVDERDMFDSGSVPGEPGFSIEQDPRDMMVGTMGGPGFGRFPLGTAGPEYVYDDAGNPIMGPGGGQRPIPPQDFGFGPGIRPTEIIGPDGSFIGSGSVTPPEDRATAIPQPDPAFDIPGVDLEKIRESLAKMEPIIPGISLPEPAPTPVPQVTPPNLSTKKGFFGDLIRKVQEQAIEQAPTPTPVTTPRPMPVKGPQPYKNIPIKAQPPVNVPMPAPMPVKGPGRIRISDPIRVPPPVNVPMPVKGPTLPIKRSPPPVKVAPLPIKRSPPPVKLPMPMPSPGIPSPIIPGPLPRVISDPVMPKPAPITRGIGGVRGGMRGRRR